MTSGEERWVEAGLLDPEAPAADERRALLAFLESVGVTVEEMLRAQEGRSLEAAAPDHVLQVEAAHTIDEVAARSGLSREKVRRVILASGFRCPEPGVTSLSEDEAQMDAALAVAMDVIGDEAILAFTRVIGNSMARVAEAADAMFLTEIEGPPRSSGGTQLDLARSAYDGAQLLLGDPDLMGLMFRRHVAGAINRSRAARGTSHVGPLSAGGRLRRPRRLDPAGDRALAPGPARGAGPLRAGRRGAGRGGRRPAGEVDG